MTVYDLVSTKEFCRSKQMIPERELLIATLDRAVLDFYGSNEEACSAAEEWLFGESDPDEVFSFSWICDHLGVNPQAAQRRIKRLSIPRKVSQAHRWLRSKVQSRDALLERRVESERRAA